MNKMTIQHTSFVCGIPDWRQGVKSLDIIEPIRDVVEATARYKRHSGLLIGFPRYETITSEGTIVCK